MSGSRSLASTTAPHLIILSTSFVHAALLSRCCRMILASWHSVHAVVAFCAIGPAGRGAVRLDREPFGPGAQKGGDPGRSNTREPPPAIHFPILSHMDLHLIDGIVKIAARI